MTTPKTKSSHAWVSPSTRVIDALEQQARRQTDRHLGHDLVFCRPNGRPLRPEYVLRHFHQLSDSAGLPRIRVHDLRHLAATLMIGSQVPLAIVSKTLRHSKLSITVDTYGHLDPHAAQQAVDAISDALTAAERPNPPAHRQAATTLRPHASKSLPQNVGSIARTERRSDA